MAEPGPVSGAGGAGAGSGPAPAAGPAHSSDGRDSAPDDASELPEGISRDTKELKVRKLFIPSHKESVKALCTEIVRAHAHVDRIVAVQKLNAMFLKIKNYTVFCDLAAECQDRVLLDTLLDMCVEGEAVSFLCLRLLCNLAHSSANQRFLGDLDVFSVLFGMFRSRDHERVRMGLELMVLCTNNTKLYHPRSLTRAGGLKVLMKLLSPEDAKHVMACVLSRCNALVLLLRALEARRTRTTALEYGVPALLDQVEARDGCSTREKILCTKIRYTLTVWQQVDKQQAPSHEDEI